MNSQGRGRRGLGSIEVRNGKFWLRLSAQPDGKTRRQRRLGPFESEQEALERQAALAPLGSAKSLTVGDWLDRFLTVRRDLLLAGNRQARYAELEQHIRTWLNPQLGRMLLAELLASDCEALWATMLNAGRSHKTVVNVRSTLVHALKAAQKDRLITDNAASLSDIPKKHQASKTTAESVAERVLHGDVLSQLEDWALAGITTETWAMACLLALDTGARRGEIVGVHWADIDFETGKMRIRQQVTTERVGESKQPILGPVKTQQSKRTIELSPRTLEALRQYRDAHPPTGLGLVFHRQGKPRNPDSWTNWVDRTLRKNLGLNRLCPHDFRHTHASHLLAAGVNVVEVSRRIGHKRTSVTLDVYGHAIPAEDSTTAAAWERLRAG